MQGTRHLICSIIKICSYRDRTASGGVVDAQPLTSTPPLLKDTVQGPMSQNLASLHSPRMDKVILLFRVIVKIATVEGVACRGHPHFNSVRGGSVCMLNLSLVSTLVNRCRFEDTLDFIHLPSMAYSTPSLSWRSFSARSWRSTLPSRWCMPFDTTSQCPRRTI